MNKLTLEIENKKESLFFVDHPTKEALGEIEELKEEIKSLQDRADNDYKKDVPHEYRDYQRKEYNKRYNKISKLEEKLKMIKELGISSKQKTQIIKLLPSFDLVKKEERIAGLYHTDDNYVKKGFWKQKNINIIVSYKKWSNFMRNVQGCASLAGKIDIDKIEFEFQGSN